MSLLERLEAKRREVDRKARAAMNRDDYLWWCDLRELFDQLIEPPMMIVPEDIGAHVYSNAKVPGHVVYRPS